MKRLFAGALAALAICGLAACGGETTNDVNSAPTQAVVEDAAIREMACGAYQRIGERSMRLSNAFDDKDDKSLSAEQRAEAVSFIAEYQTAKVPAYDSNANPDECSGPIWERYHASVIQNVADNAATSAAKASVAETGVTNWKYLQSEYSKFLGLNCGDLNENYQATCLGLQNAGIDSFARDAEELPKSKARSDVLGAIDRYKEGHDKYTDANCERPGAKSAGCITASLGMSLTYDSIVSIVNREAAAQ